MDVRPSRATSVKWSGHSNERQPKEPEKKRRKGKEEAPHPAIPAESQGESTRDVQKEKQERKLNQPTSIYRAQNWDTHWDQKVFFLGPSIPSFLSTLQVNPQNSRQEKKISKTRRTEPPQTPTCFSTWFLRWSIPNNVFLPRDHVRLNFIRLVSP